MVIDQPLLLNFRFAVSFLGWGVEGAMVDTRFQSVSGLGASVTTSTVAEGGQNLYTQSLPDKVGYSHLTLTRGRVIKSTLNSRFDAALARFEFKTTDVLVTLLGEHGIPLAAWMFYRAYPVKWSTADLSVATPAILIDTMELAYTRMQPILV
jgi:phage tail-like protein